MKHKHLYNWIAETARLLPEAQFTPAQITYRDGKTRIRVVVNPNSHTFVISNHPPTPPATPADAHEHFTNLGQSRQRDLELITMSREDWKDLPK